MAAFLSILGQILDIEKAFRKLYIHNLTPQAFSNLHNSFINISSLLFSLNNHFNINDDVINNWSSFYNYYIQQFNLDIMCDSIDYKFSFFNKGMFENIDRLNTIICDIKCSFNHIATLLENEKGVNVTLQPDQTYKTTKKAWNSIKDEVRELKIKIGDEELVCKLCDFVNVESDKKNYVKLKCDLVDSLQGMPDIDFEDNVEMFPIH